MAEYAHVAQAREGDNFIRLQMNLHEDVLHRTLLSLETQALALREFFRDERKRLQQIAQEAAHDATPVGKRPKSVYAPLNLFARARNGGLEIYWQEVHRRKESSRAMYSYLRRNEQGNYTLKELLARAQPFEKDLVAYTEQCAQKIRGYWRQHSALRQTIQAINRVAEHGALGGPGVASQVQELVASAVAGHVPELVPSLSV